MPNRKVEQVFDRHVPYQAELRAANGSSGEQRALEKRLSFWQVAERWMVRIKPPY